MSATTVPRRSPGVANRCPLFALAAALSLGTAAVLANQVPGTPGSVLQLLFGSGLAWLLAALISGALAASRGQAAIWGAVMLTGAVGVYYLVLVLFDLLAVEDVVVGLLLWGVLGLVGGSIAGLLGYGVVHASALVRALAVGAAGGAVASEAVASLLRQPPQLDVPMLMIGFGVPVVAILLCVRGRRLLGALTVAVVVGCCGGLAWVLVDTLA